MLSSVSSKLVCQKDHDQDYQNQRFKVLINLFDKQRNHKIPKNKSPIS